MYFNSLHKNSHIHHLPYLITSLSLSLIANQIDKHTYTHDSFYYLTTTNNKEKQKKAPWTHQTIRDRLLLPFIRKCDQSVFVPPATYPPDENPSGLFIFVKLARLFLAVIVFLYETGSELVYDLWRNWFCATGAYGGHAHTSTTKPVGEIGFNSTTKTILLCCCCCSAWDLHLWSSFGGKSPW